VQPKLTGSAVYENSPIGVTEVTSATEVTWITVMTPPGVARWDDAPSGRTLARVLGFPSLRVRADRCDLPTFAFVAQAPHREVGSNYRLIATSRAISTGAVALRSVSLVHSGFPHRRCPGSAAPAPSSFRVCSLSRSRLRRAAVAYGMSQLPAAQLAVAPTSRLSGMES
jgi:hypothetical protein